MNEDDEDSLGMNANAKRSTFALNYGNDEEAEEEDKFKEQKNHVKIRDLKRKLWENLRAKIIENHATKQKQEAAATALINPRKSKKDAANASIAVAAEPINFTNVMHELPRLFGESAKRVSM